MGSGESAKGAWVSRWGEQKGKKGDNTGVIPIPGTPKLVLLATWQVLPCGLLHPNFCSYSRIMVFRHLAAAAERAILISLQGHRLCWGCGVILIWQQGWCPSHPPLAILLFIRDFLFWRYCFTCSESRCVNIFLIIKLWDSEQI